MTDVPRRPGAHPRDRLRQPLPHREGRRRARSPTRTRCSWQQLATAAGFVIDNARTYGLSERRRQWLEAVAELTDALQPPVDLGLAAAPDRRRRPLVLRSGLRPPCSASRRDGRPRSRPSRTPRGADAGPARRAARGGRGPVAPARWPATPSTWRSATTSPWWSRCAPTSPSPGALVAALRPGAPAATGRGPRAAAVASPTRRRSRSTGPRRSPTGRRWRWSPTASGSPATSTTWSSSGSSRPGCSSRGCAARVASPDVADAHRPGRRRPRPHDPRHPQHDLRAAAAGRRTRCAREIRDLVARVRAGARLHPDGAHPGPDRHHGPRRAARARSWRCCARPSRTSPGTRTPRRPRSR